MENIIKYVILFFFYSSAGWCLESTYCSIGEKKLINRGFLTGPLCPIYGTAAVVLAVLIYPFRENPLLVFLLGVVVCDIVEFITSYIMEKLFAARWWDYTYEFMNLNGRISLKHSLHWGVVSVIFVELIHPAVEKLYNQIDSTHIYYILAAILLVFFIDLAYAVRKALDIRRLQLKLSSYISTLTDVLSTVKNTIGDKYSVVQNGIYKSTDKVVEFKYQIEDTVKKFEDLLSEKRPRSSSEERLACRLFYNNKGFKLLTRKQMDTLLGLIDDIKANIYEGEEKQ